MKKEMKKDMAGKKMMPAFMDKKAKKMANGGMMKYADGGMVGCGHRGAQDYGKKK